MHQVVILFYFIFLHFFMRNVIMHKHIKNWCWEREYIHVLMLKWGLMLGVDERLDILVFDRPHQDTFYFLWQKIHLVFCQCPLYKI